MPPSFEVPAKSPTGGVSLECAFLKVRVQLQDLHNDKAEAVQLSRIRSNFLLPYAIHFKDDCLGN